MFALLAYVVASLQWFLIGFSLSFSEGGSPVIGNFVWFGMHDVGNQAMLFTESQVPIIAFAFYQMQFACLATAATVAPVAGRARILPAILVMALWTTVVYDPVAYWTWGAHGWIKNMSCLRNLQMQFYIPCGIGAIDYAGGGPVFIASGFSSLAYSLILGRSRISKKPHNLPLVFLGTALLWFGFYGFDGASSIEASPRAAMSAFVTSVSASAGALSWVILDLVTRRRFSALGFCQGALSGLVGITAGAGYVAPWAAVIIGAISGVVCNVVARTSEERGVDGSAFAIHGVGGFVGFVLAGIFAQRWIGNLDGVLFFGGAIDRNVKQVSYQAAGAVAIAIWSFTVTYAILIVVNMIPGLRLRLTAEEEMKGGDYSELGEGAYDIEALDDDLKPASSKHQSYA
jgi:Amt family ammonium transporter